MKFRGKIVAFTSLVAVATIGYHIWGSSQTELEVVQDEELQMPPVSATSRDETPHEAVDPVTLAIFRPANSETVRRLQPWLDDVFLAEHALPEMIVRTTLKAIDAEHLRQSLTRSLQLSQDLGMSESASVELQLFPDRTYKIVVTQIRIGSTGYSHFGADVIGVTGLGREYFQFEVSPDGEVSGRGSTATGVYELSRTMDPEVLLVVEIDEAVVGRNFGID